MSEEIPSESAVSEDLLASLRAEFNDQLAELKTANQKLIQESQDRIATLEAENKALKAQFILSATAPAPKDPPAEPTPEEKRRAEVERLTKITSDYMKIMR